MTYEVYIHINNFEQIGYDMYNKCRVYRKYINNNLYLSVHRLLDFTGNNIFDRNYYKVKIERKVPFYSNDNPIIWDEVMYINQDDFKIDYMNILRYKKLNKILYDKRLNF